MPAAKKTTKKAAAKKPKKADRPAAKKVEEKKPSAPVADLTLSSDLEALQAQAQGIADGAERRVHKSRYQALADNVGALLDLIPKE